MTNTGNFFQSTCKVVMFLPYINLESFSFGNQLFDSKKFAYFNLQTNVEIFNFFASSKLVGGHSDYLF